MVTAVTTLVVAGGGLVAVVRGCGDDDNKPAGKHGPLPVVARLSGPQGMSERAFFSPNGMLISTQYANQPGLSVVWRGPDGERRAHVKVDPRSKISEGFTLLSLLEGETGPERRFETSNGASMKRGDPVTAYLSKESSTEGKVVGVAPGGNELGNLLVVSEVGRQSEGGTPLLDARNRKVVGMLFAEEKGVGKTYVIPIEDIRDKFPEAFD